MVVILESVQYGATSLADNNVDEAGSTWKAGEGPTPYLRKLADQGVYFTQMRSVVTHTTKAIFSLLTGRTPSAFQDIAEAIPVEKPYASLATILHDTMGYRTAFFQSAKGTFEALGDASPESVTSFLLPHLIRIRYQPRFAHLKLIAQRRTDPGNRKICATRMSDA